MMLKFVAKFSQFLYCIVMYVCEQQLLSVSLCLDAVHCSHILLKYIATKTRVQLVDTCR